MEGREIRRTIRFLEINSNQSKTEKKIKIALMSNRLCTEELGGITEFLENHKITLIIAKQQVGIMIDENSKKNLSCAELC